MVVHLGKEDFLPRYKLYVTHIAEWRQQFQNVQSVDLRYEGQVIVNPDKPAEENPPRRQPPQQAKSGLAGGPGHGDTEKTQANAGSEKPVLKTVSAKAVSPKTVAKPAAKPVSKKTVAKSASKKAPVKATNKKVAAKKSPTQTAQKQ
jgi:hypothetical protein